MQVLPILPATVQAEPSWAFVVGAPRCGTTSLSHYLEQHPDICFSDVKEPHYFAARDFPGVSDEQLRQIVHEEYVSRHFGANKASSLNAEGSVTYLYVPDRVETILRLWPDAKFIIGVRNPLSMIPSLHRRLCYIGDETELDFERAWNLVPERRKGRFVPRRCIDARWLDYWEAGKTAKYIEQFHQRFGRERCFTYVFEDLEADPGRVYRETLEFLGLPDDGQTDFSIHRDSSGFRVQWLQRLMMRPPGMMKLLGSKTYRTHRWSATKREPGPVTNALWAARQGILAWNKAPAPEVSLSPALRSEMANVFRRDVTRLGELLGRDLGHWLAPEKLPSYAPPRAADGSLATKAARG